VIGYVLFALMGFAFGYIVPGPAAFIPVIVPILLFISTAITEGTDSDLLVRLVIALVVTIGATVLGRVVARARGDAPVRASES
jgi:hypothetical protein